MELNREQIIKALECQVGTDENHECRGCFFFKEGGLCFENMSEGIATIALALIRELTEENETLTINMNAYGLTAKRLAEENDRLRAETIDYRNIPYIIAEAKADTVRKMQEETRQRCIIIGDEEYVTLCDIDQIARKILEEGKV